MRFVGTAFKNPQRVVEQAFTWLKPGGWFEIQDSPFQVLGDDDNRVPTAYITKFCELGVTGLARHGIDGLKAYHWKDWMTQAGFDGVHEQRFKGPWGPVRNLSLSFSPFSTPVPDPGSSSPRHMLLMTSSGPRIRN